MQILVSIYTKIKVLPHKDNVLIFANKLSNETIKGAKQQKFVIKTINLL